MTTVRWDAYCSLLWVKGLGGVWCVPATAFRTRDPALWRPPSNGMPSCCPALPTCVPIVLAWQLSHLRPWLWLVRCSFFFSFLFSPPPAGILGIRSRRCRLQGATSSISILPGRGSSFSALSHVLCSFLEFFVPFHCHFILCYSLGVGPPPIDRARRFPFYDIRDMTHVVDCNLTA
ncbi:uncharacterized protein LY79DRAFT_4561 [Colletotrichum navitas]|uniref:Uncharacterized protein n=1 Tax=Colletotrichum navitas TaxID=681940 RepID=A0AAD8QD45_9PEZI|nr:uncharacterized protein LY79DRAFT_4561 [Colletotrichum navitas]KAK1600039.1 hypothetical protein LY79DRAFT_4561 [Colletotrichum navitas]